MDPNQVEDIFAEVEHKPVTQPAQSPQSSDLPPEPVFEKKKFPWWIIIIIVVVLVLIVSGVLAYFQMKDVAPLNDQPIISDQSTDPSEQSEGLSINEDVDDVIVKIEEASSEDLDFDGLTNEEEKQYRTNPRKADSDNDGLFDRDEVMFYKTDPNDYDSDNDGYSDGQEVQSGYNPKGDGKLLNFQKAISDLDIN
jgi:hypothetical protein